MATFEGNIKSSVYNGSVVSGGGFNSALREVIADVEMLEINKAEKTELAALKSRVTTVETNKAEKTELAALKTTVDANTHSVDALMTLKADQRDLDALEANKAEKTDVDNLTSRVTAVEANKADKNATIVQYGEQEQDTDLNTLTHIGAYFFYSNSSDKYLNHPITNGEQTGMLIVTTQSNQVYQQFQSVSGKIYTRRRDYGRWYDWYTTTPESIGAAVKTDVDNQISAMNRHIDDQANLNLNVQFTVYSGRLVQADGTHKSSTTSDATFIDCSGCDSITFNASKYTANNGYAFYSDYAGSVFLSGGATTVTERVTIPVPSGAKTMRLSWNHTTVDSNTQVIEKRISVRDAVNDIYDKLGTMMGVSTLMEGSDI